MNNNTVNGSFVSSKQTVSGDTAVAKEKTRYKYVAFDKNGKQVIDNNTLTALTLLIAESNPKEKDVIIDLVMNFLNNE